MRIDVTYEQPKDPPVQAVTITLTEDEAKMLEAVTARIFGWDRTNNNQIRNLVDRIHTNLMDKKLYDTDMRQHVSNNLLIE